MSVTFSSAYALPRRTPQMRTLARLAVTTVLVAAPIAAVAVTTVAQAAADPAPVTVVTSDFEDNTVQGWTGRNTETLAAGTTVAHGGTHSLSITGRTATWNGPSLDVLSTFVKGTSYTISAWVRMVDTSDSARISVERRSAGVASYDTVVGNTAVTSGGGGDLVRDCTPWTAFGYPPGCLEIAPQAGWVYPRPPADTFPSGLPCPNGIPSLNGF